MSPTDGYTIDDARHAMGLSAPDEELYQAAELAVLEHERAERLERNGQARERLLTRRTDALRAAERRVAELEQWRADVTHAVEALTERKVEHFSSCDWCGACSPEEAEGRCEPREDQTGERSCPAIDGPVAEVWDDGANPVVLLLREELQHAALVSDELKRLAARVAAAVAASAAGLLDAVSVHVESMLSNLDKARDECRALRNRLDALNADSEEREALLNRAIVVEVERDEALAQVAALEAELARRQAGDFAKLSSHIRGRMERQVASAVYHDENGDERRAAESRHQADALWAVLKEWDSRQDWFTTSSSTSPAAKAINEARAKRKAAAGVSFHVEGTASPPCIACEGERHEGEICDRCGSVADGCGGFFVDPPAEALNREPAPSDFGGSDD